MKVVKITADFPPKRGGIGDYTRLLCENLVNLKKDMSFYIITSADPKIIESSYSYERIEVLPIVNDWSFSSLKLIRKRIKEISPDIIHIEYNRRLYGCAIAVNFLSYFLKKKDPSSKIVVTFHDLPGPLKNRDPFFWLTSLFVQFFCDRAIVTNDIDFNNFICKLPFIKRKCTLVPVGSGIHRIENRRTDIRKELSIPKDVTILSFFGFIRKDKSLNELFYAFSGLLRIKPNVKLLIIGGIRDKDFFLSLQKLCHKLNLNGAVTWIDYQSDRRISELLSASDIAILPYKNGISTNSSAFAACALHNLPIVTTNAKFMPEVIKDNYNLLSVRQGDIKKLTKALFRLTADADLRERLTKNLKGLNDYLSWQRISQRISKLYTELQP